MGGAAVIHIFSAGNAFFLAFLLATHPGKAHRLANRLLAGFCFCIAMMLMDDVLGVLKVYEQFPQLYGYDAPFFFIISPLLYLSVSQYVAIRPGLHAGMIVHMILPGIWTLLNLPFIFLDPSLKRKIYLEDLVSQSAGLSTDPAELGIVILLYSQVFLYWILSIRLLIRHRRNVEKVLADTHGVQLNWLLGFLAGVGIMIVLWMIDVLVFPTPLEEVPSVAPFYLLLLYFLSYFVLRQRDVYPFPDVTRQEIGEILKEKTTEERKAMFTPATLESQKSRLLIYMEIEKPFLDNDLSLPSLAQHISLSAHELSYLINEGYGVNFNQFVNRFRVEEAMQMLSNGQLKGMSLADIGFEAGFNSRSAFHTAFKKHTGVSPSEFRSKSLSQS